MIAEVENTSPGVHGLLLQIRITFDVRFNLAAKFVDGGHIVGFTDELTNELVQLWICRNCARKILRLRKRHLWSPSFRSHSHTTALSGEQLRFSGWICVASQMGESADHFVGIRDPRLNKGEVCHNEVVA